ncbi:MAG TPA: D-cysteine desulfhydrase family protein [Methylomirabilota bacterium]|jgi:D-cysteine desulfhydrase|nr:D-cysteine desulfhydrase family protein [Methylomirabilota bacterium]
MATSAPPIPRIELAYAPTPLLKLERLSAELGVELWVKRDDLTGLLETGNKIRKLEFLIGEALAQGADTLITCGTLQSNCCRTVAAVSARLGLRAVLALKGEPPATYDGNLLLDRMLGADVRYVSDDDWRKIDEVMQDMGARERAQGRAPYLIPESGATVTGALGYLACGQELAQQAKHGAPEFDTVVITAFSGGSQAGLLMARQVAGLRADVVSVPIAWTADRVREYVVDVIDRARKRYGLAVDPPREVRVLDGFQGVGRADVRREELETVLRLARLEGIVLDPVYTAKAFGGLLDTLRADPRALGRRVCFVHTGGVFSVFPFREPLSRLINS